MQRRPPGFIDKGYFVLQADHPDCDSFQSLLRMKEAEDVKNILLIFRAKLRRNVKLFHANILHPKRFSLNFIRIILKKIIPIKLFGSLHNFKKFFKIIIKLCTSSIQENIYIKYLLHGWRIEDVVWLMNCLHKELVLTKLVMWLVTFVRKYILRFIYFIQRDTRSYQVNFFCLSKYRSICDKSVHDMIRKKQLIPTETVTESNCILRICPKPNGYRPVIRTSILNGVSAKIVGGYFNGRGLTFDRSLYSAWLKCVHKVGNKRLYGIKLDLKDAFSNVDIGALKPLINKFLSSHPALRRKVLASLQNQTVKFQKRVYKWNRGIMQGMRLSASLCDLERSFFDAGRLRKYIKIGALFHRTVDDYFYCSTEKNDVLEFSIILENNCIISKNKTETNIVDNNKIVYNGRKFNLETKEIEINIERSLTTYRFKSRMYYLPLAEYSEKSILQFLIQVSSRKSNAFNFSRELFNVSYNSKEVVLDNYFKAMLVVAFKVDCAIKERLVKVPENLHSFIKVIVERLVYSTRQLLISSKRNKEEPMNMPRKLFRIIGYKAFIIVMKLRYIPYKNTIQTLQKQTHYKHPLIGNKFRKLPEEFANIRTRRVAPEFK